MHNPFVYGEIVPASAFVDREDELDRLVGDLTAGQKVFLISPRRYGKSSLIHQALGTIRRRGALTTEVTVSSYSSYQAFLEGFTRALVATETRPAHVQSWLRELIQSARAEVRYDSDACGPEETGGRSGRLVRRAARLGLPEQRSSARSRDGELTVAFPAVRTGRDLSRLAEEIYQVPARIAAARRRRVVIALDEFQAIGAFDGGSVEHALRAAIQHQRQVGYVFAGSEPALMERMLGPRRPFYKAGPVMRLQKIPSDPFAAFVESQFARTGMRPEPGLGLSVIELAGNMPYDIQRLAHETWDDVRAARRRLVGHEDLHRTLKRLLAEQDTMFERIWQRLTLVQRATLRACVFEDGAGLLASDTRLRHRLGGASTVQASLTALVREEIITRDDEGRYLVVDSLMREWVARKTF